MTAAARYAVGMWWIWVMTVASAEPVIDGEYVLADSASTLSSKHAAALDDALAQLPWAARPFAKPKLAAALKNCDKVRLALDSAQFEAVCDGDAPFRQDRAKSNAFITGDGGKRYDVALTVTDDRLTVQFTGEEGGQRTVYVPETQGTLNITKELFSKWLPEPVRWTVKYTPAP